MGVAVAGVPLETGEARDEDGEPEAEPTPPVSVAVTGHIVVEMAMVLVTITSEVCDSG